MTAQDARERAWQEWLQSAGGRDSWRAFRFAWDAAKRDDEQRIAALEAAARQVVNDYLGSVPMLRVSITELRRALTGAPFEPDEAMVERAAIALYDDSRGKDHGNIPVWGESREQPRFRRWAHIALKAALAGSEETGEAD